MNTRFIVIGAVVVVALGAFAYTQLPKGRPDMTQGTSYSTMATADAPA